MTCFPSTCHTAERAADHGADEQQLGPAGHTDSGRAERPRLLQPLAAGGQQAAIHTGGAGRMWERVRTYHVYKHYCMKILLTQTGSLRFSP